LETYLHDAAGNPVTKTDRNGHSILYVYDALNRLTHKGYPDSTGVDYVYDLRIKLSRSPIQLAPMDNTEEFTEWNYELPL
jgi:YD repeat-containing protein